MIKLNFFFLHWIWVRIQKTPESGSETLISGLSDHTEGQHCVAEIIFFGSAQI